MKRLGIALALVTAALLVPSIARADDDDPPPLPAPTQSSGGDPKVTTSPGISTATNVDTVHLRNGGMYRGRVTEILPGSHVTIITGANETKKVAWAEVDRVIVGSTAVPPPPAGGTYPNTPSGAAAGFGGTAPLPAPMVGPKARVHVTSPKQVILYRKPAGSNNWVPACTSPCNAELPIGDAYRVLGNGVAQSKEFHLDAGPGGSTEVAVDPPSGGGMVLGGIMAGGGATAMYFGFLLTVVGIVDANLDCSKPNDLSNSRYNNPATCEKRKEDGPKLREAGLITMGVSAAITGVGILVFLNSAKTDVVQHGGGGSGKANQPNTAFLRTPEWRGSSSSASAATPAPIANFPVLFSGRF